MLTGATVGKKSLWNGPQWFVTVRGAHVSAECGPEVCDIELHNAESPIEPLPLP